MQIPPSAQQQSTAWSALTPEVVISLAVGIVSTVAGTLLYDKIKSRSTVQVKRIQKASDKDVEGFVELYERLIDDSVRIESSEIIRWVDEDRVLRRLTTHSYLHYLYIGKVGGRAVSFLKAMYCTDSRYMFIAYYGIDTDVDAARKLAAPAMMKELAKLVTMEVKDCKAILCEVELPDRRLDPNENAKRKARLRLFKETARRLGYRMYELGFEYLQPNMDVNPSKLLAQECMEECMSLLYIPVKDGVPANRRLPKEKVLDILCFVYLQIYRPTYRHDPQNDYAYQQYLNSLIGLYEDLLPEYVPLKD